MKAKGFALMGSLVGVLATIATIAPQSAFGFDCESDENRNITCVSLPDEAPERWEWQNVGSARRAPERQPSRSMLTAEEKTGAALSVENEFLADEALAPATRAELTKEDSAPVSLISSSEALGKLKMVEFFLKNESIASTTDRARAAGKKD